jgi:hypothetical protein
MNSKIIVQILLLVFVGMLQFSAVHAQSPSAVAPKKVLLIGDSYLVIDNKKVPDTDSLGMKLFSDLAGDSQKRVLLIQERDLRFIGGKKVALADLPIPELLNLITKKNLGEIDAVALTQVNTSISPNTTAGKTACTGLLFINAINPSTGAQVFGFSDTQSLQAYSAQDCAANLRLKQVEGIAPKLIDAIVRDGTKMVIQLYSEKALSKAGRSKFSASLSTLSAEVEPVSVKENAAQFNVSVKSRRDFLNGLENELDKFVNQGNGLYDKANIVQRAGMVFICLEGVCP